MSIQAITSFINATRIVDVQLTLDGQPFEPGDDYSLLLSAKEYLSQADDLAWFQLSDVAGIVVTGSTARCTLVPQATVDRMPKKLEADIRATHKVTGESHIVALMSWDLKRPPTRETEPSVPVFTQLPPVYGDQLVFSRFDGYYYRLFIGPVEGDPSGLPTLQAELYSLTPVDSAAPVVYSRVDGGAWLIFIDETDGDGVPVIQYEPVPAT
ncbi:MAG: hypothetical protein EOP87_00885 [Verrucomicrobiaceae bacterium]|nr:MAG: hypothetical protein EOP87_00885 [Verrucomicrobiaceae bacterium]